MRVFSKSFRGSSKPEGISLSNLRIASPCPADWEKMVGDERVRHCSECNLTVYNLSAMSERHVQALIAGSRGKRLCERFYRRADGTVLTQDCPWGFQALKRRVSRVTGTILSAVLSVGVSVANAMPQKSMQPTGASQDHYPDLVVTVLDPQGAVIADARVTLTSSKSKLGSEPQAKGATDRGGRVQLSSVVPGEYTVTVEAKYFKTERRSFRMETGNASLVIKPSLDPIAGATVEVGGVEAPLIQTEAQVTHTFPMDR